MLLAGSIAGWRLRSDWAELKVSRYHSICWPVFGTRCVSTAGINFDRLDAVDGQTDEIDARSLATSGMARV